MTTYELRLSNAELHQSISKLKKLLWRNEKIPEAYGGRWLDIWFIDHFNSFRMNVLSTIGLDIDKFKWVNETFGHNQGDVILARLVKFVNTVLGKLTRVNKAFNVRYGGEEFYVELPGVPFYRAIQIAQQIRAEFDGNTSIFDGLTKLTPAQMGEHREMFYAKDFLTLSLGVSSTRVPDRQLERDEIIVLVGDTKESADKAEYEAKRRGRNMVLVHMGDANGGIVDVDTAFKMLEQAGGGN